MAGAGNPNETQEAGFTLVEILTTLLIMTVVTAIAATVMTSVIPTVHADSSLELVEAELRQAREAAMDQRRTFVVTFNGTNEITVQRIELTGSLTFIADYFLGEGVTYTLIPTAPDTPDSFGNSMAVNFSGTNSFEFLGDGTAVNASGQLVNGTVFMAISANPITARAVTVMGATGRIKGYTYNGTEWN
ncbi:MAG: pilus assembly FimT family protein [Terriglobia bacterium]